MRIIAIASLLLLLAGCAAPKEIQDSVTNARVNAAFTADQMTAKYPTDMPDDVAACVEALEQNEKILRPVQAYLGRVDPGTITRP